MPVRAPAQPRSHAPLTPARAPGALYNNSAAMATCLQTHSLEMLAVGVPLPSLAALPNCTTFAQPAPAVAAAAVLNPQIETPGFAVSAAAAGRGGAAAAALAAAALSLFLL